MCRQWIIKGLAIILITGGKAFKILFHHYFQYGAIRIGNLLINAHLLRLDPLLHLRQWQGKVHGLCFQLDPGFRAVFCFYTKVQGPRADPGFLFYLTGLLQGGNVLFVQPVPDAVAPDPYLHSNSILELSKINTLCRVYCSFKAIICKQAGMLVLNRRLAIEVKA